MKINALCTDNIKHAAAMCDSVVACGSVEVACDNIKFVTPFTKETSSGDIRGDIYLPSILDEDLLGSACDYIFNTGAHAIVRAAHDLEESGIVEAKYRLSPVMLLHKLGIIDKCTIAGGVCLDNDDMDLMAQEGVPLVLLPTADAGYGHGYAPVCAAARRGIKIGVGTFDCKYNPTADLDYEINFLRLTANAEMRTENALSDEQAKKILAFE